MLTKTELRLLSILEEDGKASYASMAQKLGINISTVARNIKSLHENKMFTVNAVPNPYRLGYRARALIAMNVNLNKVNSLCDEIKKNFFVPSIYIIYGRFNILMSTQFPTWDKLHDFISSDIFTLRYIRETEIFFVRDVKKHYSSLFHNPDSSEQTPLQIDETDQQIMEELSRDGSRTNSCLAHNLGINVSRVSRKVSSLLKKDAIRIQAIPDPTKIGYDATAFILVRCQYNKLEDICTELISYKNIFSIITLVNGYNIYLSITAKDQEITNDLIIKKIPQIHGINSIETLILGKIIKHHYRIPLKDMLTIDSP